MMEIQVVTQQMLEILVNVARMPVKYRQIRKVELIQDYDNHLTCAEARAVFYALINSDSSHLESSEKAKSCLQAVIRLAGRSEALT